MKNLELFKQTKLNLFKNLGFVHPFWEINLNTIVYTWLVLFVLACIILLARFYLNKKNSVGQFLILSFIKSFKEQIVESLGSFNFNNFVFIVSAFIFIFLCNVISLIPFVDEPTVDLNTTLAFGLISFGYVQINSILHNGLINYMKGYLEPFFLLAPVNIIGSLSTIVSMSFRLFGNIFGGAVIHHLFHMAISGIILLEITVIPINIVLTAFFVLFEGFIQAFVFSMLTLTYLAVEVQE